MDRTALTTMVQSQRAFYQKGATKSLPFRIQQLRKLRSVLAGNEREIFNALKTDLRKPAYEAYGGEVGAVISEIDYALDHIREWCRPKRAATPLALFPSSSWVRQEPYGVALIIGTWNFPFQLTLTPLVGAVGAGNCAVIKCSDVAPASSRLISRLAREEFDPRHIALVEGGADEARMLLEERFDYIFFTGSTRIAREVMAAAARNLTPITLELGGKNPCIVDRDVNLEYAARRIVWGKFMNAGQSCVAVDHVLADRHIRQRLVETMTACIEQFYGPDPYKSEDFCRIVNGNHVDRIARLMQHGTIVTGGRIDRQARYISPTIISDLRGDEPIMEEEIFGPLLPVMEYDDVEEAIARINSGPKPLALYLFSRSRHLQERVLRETQSGGVCVNDTVVQETSKYMPFGGVGESGFGRYHGRDSFLTFSHQRSVIWNNLLFDIPLRYPPYKGSLKWLRRIL